MNEIGEHLIKLNNEEIAIAGEKKIYLIDINKYLLYEINSDYSNCSILKLSSNLFLVWDSHGTITQYKIDNKKIIKESIKNKNNKNDDIRALTIIKDMIISGSCYSKEIRLRKK